jgi:exopolysaccharide biosynthesis polyprenyl glycosylphosphotransferase
MDARGTRGERMLKERAHIAGTISLLADAAITAVSVWLAFYVYFLLYQYRGPEIYLPFTGYRLLPLYREFGVTLAVVGRYLVAMPVILVTLEVYGLHDRIGFRTPSETLRILLRGHVVAAMVLAIVGVVLKLELFRVLLIGVMGINIALIWLKELIIIEYVLQSRERGYNFREVLIVGVGEIARKMIERLHSHPHWGFRVVGCMVPPTMRDEPSVNGLDNLGVYAETPQVLKARHPDLVVFAVDKRYIAEAEPAIYACEEQGIDIWMIPDFFTTTVAKYSFDDFERMPVMAFRTTPEYSWQIIFKDVFDRVAAALMLIVVSLLMALVALLVKATSRGPVLFRQVRQGFRGRPFTLYKFRTMVSNAEQLKAELEVFNEMDEVVFKIQRDPRITPIGGVLRKWSIDELPQLFNILKGEMSLVGPRPMLHTEIDKFKYWQRRKLSVKPGLTCLWQISGRSNLTFEEWMRLDLEYIDHWSLGLDLQILLRTIPVVLIAKGAK